MEATSDDRGNVPQFFPFDRETILFSTEPGGFHHAELMTLTHPPAETLCRNRGPLRRDQERPFVCHPIVYVTSMYPLHSSTPAQVQAGTEAEWELTVERRFTPCIQHSTHLALCPQSIFFSDVQRISLAPTSCQSGVYDFVRRPILSSNGQQCLLFFLSPTYPITTSSRGV